jgi:hypothetical protein
MINSFPKLAALAAAEGYGRITGDVPDGLPKCLCSPSAFSLIPRAWCKPETELGKRMFAWKASFDKTINSNLKFGVLDAAKDAARQANYVKLVIESDLYTDRERLGIIIKVVGSELSKMDSDEIKAYKVCFAEDIWAAILAERTEKAAARAVDAGYAAAEKAARVARVAEEKEEKERSAADRARSVAEAERASRVTEARRVAAAAVEAAQLAESGGAATTSSGSQKGGKK